MITYLPQIYPDELFYSWLCRYYVHSGCVSHKAALSDIFCKRSDNPNKEFIGHLNSDAQKQIEKCYPIKKLILEHTMFPQYARFIPLEDKKKALYHLEFDFKDIHHLFCVLPRTDTDRYLKYCPLCATEDRRLYGEAYWHRLHQIRNMQICPKHNCMLVSSTVTASSVQTFTFSPAEQYATDTEPTAVKNNLGQKYAEYLTDVFNAPIDFTNDIPINSVFYYAMLDTPYMKSTGTMRYTLRLADDLTAYYNKVGISDIASMYQIQRLLLGSRFDFSVACQLAFYLNMSVADLTVPKISATQIEKERQTHYMRNKPPVDWDSFDDETVPQLERLAKSIYNGTASDNGRPERVSEKIVYRELDLSSHRLEQMPKCQAVFNRYTETYQESWARKVIWAYQKLSERKKTFYWSDIKKLSGVKKKNIVGVIPYLTKHTDNATAEHIITLIGNY